MTVRIEKVAGGRALHEFVTFPWKVYARDPHWVPPLIRDMKKTLTHHPFLEHAAVDYFVARIESGSAGAGGRARGRLVARAAVIENRLHNEIHGERVAFFGFFDILRDGAPEGASEVARALFGELERWAAARNLDTLRGPASFSSNEEWGLLIDGFTSSPCVMMTYNPPHYAGLLEECGFRKAKDVVAYYLDNPDPPERVMRVAEKMATRKGVTVRSLDMRRFDEEVAGIRTVYNRAWEKNWGFVPMTEAEFSHMAREMKPIIKPDLVLIAEKDGEPVGFTMAIPDANQALKHANGRLFPFGLLKILWYARKIRMVRVPVLGLVPEIQGAGIDQLLYLRLFQGGRRLGIKAGEFSWILEDNLRMRQALDKLDAHVYKTYRIYEKPVAMPAGEPVVTPVGARG
ncbi:MAG: N-acetyltransferase [Candidatus Eisenbacteria bacterium]